MLLLRIMHMAAKNLREFAKTERNLSKAFIICYKIHIIKSSLENRFNICNILG